MPSRAKKRTTKTKSTKPANKRQYVIRPGRTGDWPFSDGVWAGSTFYLSGHLGVDRTVNRPPENVEDEVRLMLDTFKATLAAAKLTMQDLVYVQIFCSDVSLFASIQRSLSHLLWQRFSDARLYRFRPASFRRKI